MSGRRGLRCDPRQRLLHPQPGRPRPYGLPASGLCVLFHPASQSCTCQEKQLPPSFRERRRIFRQKVANLANATFAKMKVANLANATFAKMKVANLAVPVHVPAHVPVPVPVLVPVPVRKGSCCLLSCFFFLSNTAGSGNSGGGTRTPPLKGVEKQPAPANKKARMETVVCIHAGFSQVAPAGVEPAMGESKSPALPLGDGASFIARRPGGPRTPCKLLYHICRACASAAHQIQPITRSGR